MCAAVRRIYGSVRRSISQRQSALPMRYAEVTSNGTFWGARFRPGSHPPARRTCPAFAQGTGPFVSWPAPTARTTASGPVHFSAESAKTLARGRARHARLHFLHWDIFDMRADRPLVAEWIEKGSRTIAVELIFYRTQHFGSCCDGLL